MKLDEIYKTEFHGVNYKISKEVLDFLVIKKSGLIQIEVEYRDPFGFHKAKEIIEFDLK
jgi:hypothetical protein